jgi:3-hydroxyisobutyrate dehydrogenase-like beta-hydroxyacid dehydrogenase
MRNSIVQANDSQSVTLICVQPLTIRLMHKDLTYALRAADELGVPAPLVASAHEVYKMALQLGLGDLDIAAISDVLRERQP